MDNSDLEISPEEITSIKREMVCIVVDEQPRAVSEWRDFILKRKNSWTSFDYKMDPIQIFEEPLYRSNGEFYGSIRTTINSLSFDYPWE